MAQVDDALCVYSIDLISVLINGSPSHPFAMRRGLRQGCSLSPLLFNLIAEGLNVLLSNAVAINLFQGISVSSSGPIISHIQFADDLLIFAKANEDAMCNIKRVLLIFESFSGLKLNMKKTKLFGINVEDSRIQAWADSIKCSWGNLPTEYLGLPLGCTKNSAGFWDPILKKFHSRLAGWKSKLLSLGGRIALVNSVLSNLPVYYMSLFLMPKAVSNRLNKMIAFFIWSSSAISSFWDVWLNISFAGSKFQRNKIVSLGVWKAPPVGFLKFNVDGAVSGSFGAAGIGGILRNHENQIVYSFHRSAGFLDPTSAEILAIVEAVSYFLSWRWCSSFRLIIESDSSLAVSWINSPHNQVLVASEAYLKKNKSNSPIAMYQTFMFNRCYGHNGFLHRRRAGRVGTQPLINALDMESVVAHRKNPHAVTVCEIRQTYGTVRAQARQDQVTSDSEAAKLGQLDAHLMMELSRKEKITMHKRTDKTVTTFSSKLSLFPIVGKDGAYGSNHLLECNSPSKPWRSCVDMDMVWEI
ncbi:hypothetical protein GQ457_09G011730 [Hibiscus cannabinus]